MSEKDKKQLSAFKSLLPIFSFIKPYKLVAFLALLVLLFTSGLNLLLGQGVKHVIDHGFIEGSVEQLTNAAFFMITLIVFFTLGTFTRFYLMSWIGERVCNDIRKAVFHKIIYLHPSYFEENRSGELMSRLTTDTTLLQSIVGSSFSMALRSILMMTGGLIMLFILNFKLTLIVLLCMPLALLPLFFFGKRVRKLSENSQSAIADISTYAGEIIQNIKVVQSYTHEKNERAAFDQEVEKAFTVAKYRITQRAILIASVIGLTFSSITVMLLIGGMDVIAGRMSGGALAAFVFYAVIVASSIATISEVYGELQRAAGAATRLLDLLNVKSDIINKDDALQLNWNNNACLKFENVTFHYPSRPETAALNAVSLTNEKGKIVAIVGPSGAGKTTLFELLQRFYDPEEGAISLGEQPINSLTLDSLRQSMGIVQQNPILFSSDVWHNIRYGNPHATDEQVIEAAKRAHAHDFIVNLPEGYDSFLGEQGVRLSGGQKQRIAIARAILKNPSILLLDEATSALDAESEFHVQAALKELMKHRTTLIIAHRLATVMHADTIV